MDFETVIGLEVHVELLTKTKLFCSCPNRFGAPTNSQVCPVCLGLPGVLPVINRRAIELHVRAALAIGCTVAEWCRFDRKNYFYPDMPKNYQISQYDHPLAEHGVVEIQKATGTKRIGVRRIHLEEDTGKSVHEGTIAQSAWTREDYNRAGVPLLEIVSEPDISSPDEAYEYLMVLRDILSWIEVSDCRMEEGSLRCDANISLRPAGATGLGTKVEVKNMNSFKSVRSALRYEEERQRRCLLEGAPILQETRGWDEERQVTISMRTKEETHDYRYFPEPDLVPLTLSREVIDLARAELPELPCARKKRFIEEYGLPEYDAGVLTSARDFADFFEETAKLCGNPKTASNWMMGEVRSRLKATDVPLAETRLTPPRLAEMISLIQKGTISGSIAKSLLEELLVSDEAPQTIVLRRGWAQISGDEVLRPVILEILESNADCVDEYLSGKEKILGFLVGQVMKRTKGTANPGAINALMREEIEKRRLTA